MELITNPTFTIDKNNIDILNKIDEENIIITDINPNDEIHINSKKFNLVKSISFQNVFCPSIYLYNLENLEKITVINSGFRLCLGENLNKISKFQVMYCYNRFSIHDRNFRYLNDVKEHLYLGEGYNFILNESYEKCTNLIFKKSILSIKSIEFPKLRFLNSSNTILNGGGNSIFSSLEILNLNDISLVKENNMNLFDADLPNLKHLRMEGNNFQKSGDKIENDKKSFPYRVKFKYELRCLEIIEIHSDIIQEIDLNFVKDHSILKVFYVTNPNTKVSYSLKDIIPENKRDNYETISIIKKNARN